MSRIASDARYSRGLSGREDAVRTATDYRTRAKRRPTQPTQPSDSADVLYHNLFRRFLRALGGARDAVTPPTGVTQDPPDRLVQRPFVPARIPDQLDGQEYDCINHIAC